ncbi:MAG: folylpolyglutamate synthase/dihydrofolate synthase family protein [Arenicellales bacterium]
MEPRSVAPCTPHGAKCVAGHCVGHRLTRRSPLSASRSLEDWLEYIQTVHFRSIDMSLDRVQVVLERFGGQLSFKVLAVAGTNGKGSCAAMLGSILEACGYKVGIYTSPHLVRFNERICATGPADDAELCLAFEEIELLRGGVPLTYFEFATLAAVHIFQKRGVDVAVMEVGMGGRLDAVNALSIDASLITNVELDHMQWLGKDREAIGYEKAHIMRGGHWSVYNGASPPRSLLDYAARIGTRLLLAGRDYRHEATGNEWRWYGPKGEVWTLERPPIPGAVQTVNAAGVLALLTAWEEVEIDRDGAARGLANTHIRARCEMIAREPMVVIDVSHNLSAVQTLSDYLAVNRVAGRTTAIFGMLKDKDPLAAARIMNPHVDAWCLATIGGERGQEAGELSDSIAHTVRGTVHCHGSAGEAYECALRHSGAKDRIVGFGSFHIAGDILAHMTRPS